MNPLEYINQLQRRSLTDTGNRILARLRGNRKAWRKRATWNAIRSLANLGGVDMAASLAYYTLLSFFPFISLLVVIVATFFDSQTVQEQIYNMLSIYFPASEEFLDSALTQLFESRPVAGIIALVGMLLGANGLLLASSRAVNRIFGCRPQTMLHRTALDVMLGLLVVLLFMGSIVLSGLLQVAFNLGSDNSVVGGLISVFSNVFTQVIFVVAPPIITWIVFVIVYRMLPNRFVHWRDAAFGAIVAVILFEVAKYAFFWFGSIASQRNLLYGPLSSVIILFIWSHIASVIFLFGASITKEAATCRPRVAFAA